MSNQVSIRGDKNYSDNEDEIIISPRNLSLPSPPDQSSQDVGLKMLSATPLLDLTLHKPLAEQDDRQQDKFGSSSKSSIQRQDYHQNNQDDSQDDHFELDSKPIKESVKTKEKERKNTKKSPKRTARKTWISLVNLITCCLPTKLLLYFFKGNYHVVTAFREKLVLNLLILLLSFIFFFLVIGFGWIVCPQSGKVLNEFEVKALTSKSYPLVIAYGYFYLIKDVYKDHVLLAGYQSPGAFEATVLGIYNQVLIFVRV